MADNISDYVFVTLDGDGKINGALFPAAVVQAVGGKIPNSLLSSNVPLIGSNGKLDAGIIPSANASLPTGGTTGQVLSKRTNADGDVQWSNVASGNSLQHFDWYFPGLLSASANHDAYVLTPASSIWGASRNLVAITVTVGSIGFTATGTLPTFRVSFLVDGAEVAFLNLGGSALTSSTVLGTPVAITYQTRLNVAVTVNGGSGTFTPSRDLTASMWVV